MSIRDLPVYGPTDPFGDEEHEPEVIVRVDFLMSREQITTVLGMAWAEIAGGGRSPADLPVVEVRHEAEAWLSVQAFHELGVQMERDRLRTWPPEQQHVMQLLAGAVERAYPASTMVEAPRSPEFAAEFPHVAAHLARERGETPAVQRPVYEGGTVTLDTLDAGRITIDEPVWCTGHDGEQVVDRVDVTHVGVTVTGEYAGVEFLPACISWGPFAQLRPEPLPLADVDDFPGMTPDELRELGVEVVRHGCALHSKANELDRIRRGMS